jgi:polyisoprenoid-binding protein YceI
MRGIATALSTVLLLSAATAAELVEAGRTLRVDPGSARAGFDLGATMHTVHGTAGDVKGTVSIVSASSEGFVLDGKIAIAVRSLGTGNDRRDAKMRGESLGGAEHPEITFAPKALDRALHTLSGDLTIRGVSKKVAIPVTVAPAGDRIKVDGKLDVRWADHGVPDPSVFLLRVDDVAHTSFHVELVR